MNILVTPHNCSLKPFTMVAKDFIDAERILQNPDICKELNIPTCYLFASYSLSEAK